MKFGTVISFKPEGHFGFIQADGDKEKFFFHISAFRMVMRGKLSPYLSDRIPEQPRIQRGVAVAFMPEEREPARGESRAVLKLGFKSYWEKFRVYLRIRRAGKTHLAGELFEILAIEPLPNDVIEKYCGQKNGAEVWKTIEDPRINRRHKNRFNRRNGETAHDEEKRSDSLPVSHETQQVIECSPGISERELENTDPQELEALALGAGGQMKGKSQNRDW